MNKNGAKRDNMGFDDKSKAVRNIKERIPLNAIYRTILTLVMITFFFLILSTDKIWLFIFVYILKTLSYREVVRILNSTKNARSKELFLSWYFMIVADLYFTGKTLGNIYSSFVPQVLVKHHLFYCFSLYIVGFIFFVINLQTKSLKSQFAQFAATHITIYIACIACNLSINNIANGKAWFAYPALLVVTNDITAYIFGKLCGKRQLFKLSPNKTWEGFLGGMLCTSIVGLALCYIKVYYMIPDQADVNLLSEQQIQIGNFVVKIKNIYVHATFFVLFASFVAPFGGFFASAFKRAFKVKDFGEAIPGHGGIMDRMDCQFLMGVFTYVYYRTFLVRKMVTKRKIYEVILNNLNKEEIKELINDLRGLIK